MFWAVIIAVESASDAAMPMQKLVTGKASAANLFAVIDETSSIEHQEGSEAPLPTSLQTLQTVELRDVKSR